MSSQPQRGDGRAHEQRSIDSAEQCPQQSSQSHRAASFSWEGLQASVVFNTRVQANTHASQNFAQQGGGEEAGSSGFGGQLNEEEEEVRSESSSQTATPPIPTSFTKDLDRQLGQANTALERALGQLASIPCEQLPAVVSQLLVFSHTMQSLFKKAEDVSTTEKLGVAAMSYQAAGKIVDGMREQWENAVARLDPLALGHGPYSASNLATIERALIENNLGALLAKPSSTDDNAESQQLTSTSASGDDGPSTVTLTQSALFARMQSFDEAVTRAWQGVSSTPGLLGQSRRRYDHRGRSD